MIINTEIMQLRSAVRSNQISRRQIYIQNGSRRRQNTLKLYYKNTGSLHFNTNMPKMIVEKDLMKKENFNLVSITRAGIVWMEPACKLVRSQLKKINKSIRVTTLYVDQNRGRFE